MQLTKEALNEFEKLWQQDHPGKLISRDDLLRMANRVIRIVELFYMNESNND